jgi:hypothetical protein
MLTELPAPQSSESKVPVVERRQRPAVRNALPFPFTEKSRGRNDFPIKMPKICLVPIVLSVSLLLAPPMSTTRAGTPIDAVNFSESVFSSNAALAMATGLAWAPDGSNRLFVILKGGQVKIIKNGMLLGTTFATITPIFTNSATTTNPPATSRPASSIAPTAQIRAPSLPAARFGTTTSSPSQPPRRTDFVKAARSRLPASPPGASTIRSTSLRRPARRPLLWRKPGPTRRAAEGPPPPRTSAAA